MAFNFIDPNASGLAKAVLGGISKSVVSVSAGITASAPSNSELSAVFTDTSTGEYEAFHLVKGKVKSLTSQEWKPVTHGISEMIEAFKKDNKLVPCRVLMTVSRDGKLNRFLADYSLSVEGGSLEDFKSAAQSFKRSVLDGSWNALKFEEIIC